MRRELRATRRVIPESRRRENARALARRLARLHEFRAAGSVAAYVANDGEIDPAPALALARRMGKRTLLPVLRGAALGFVTHAADQRLVPNRFGIPEPAAGDLLAPRALDVVLVPLVGFDGHGNRLGMGGGFYDRTFAFLRHRTRWRRPHLVGVAHEEQRVDSLEARSWDVRLDVIITPRGALRPRRGANDGER